MMTVCTKLATISTDDAVTLLLYAVVLVTVMVTSWRTSIKSERWNSTRITLSYGQMQRLTSMDMSTSKVTDRHWYMGLNARNTMMIGIAALRISNSGRNSLFDFEVADYLYWWKRMRIGLFLDFSVPWVNL